MKVIQSMLRSTVAIVCMFATVNVMAQGSGIHAARATAQAINVANNKYTSGPMPTGDQFRNLADTLDKYIDAADKDGALVASANRVLRHRDLLLRHSGQVAVAAHRALRANGWMGTREDVDSMLVRVGPNHRAYLATRIQREGLKNILREGSGALRQLGRKADRGELRPASFHPRHGARLILASIPSNSEPSQTLNGVFYGLGAIGAVASLGGVDPLGDLLLAIAGVGAAGVYVYDDMANPSTSDSFTTGISSGGGWGYSNGYAGEGEWGGGGYSDAHTMDDF